MTIRWIAVIALMLGGGCAMLFEQGPSDEEKAAIANSVPYVQMLDKCEEDRAACDDALDRCQKKGLTLLPHIR